MPSTPKFLSRPRALASLIAVLAVLTTACSPRLQAQLARRAAAAPAMTSTERVIIDAVNRFRGNHGLRALQVNSNLQGKARAWAGWMAAGHCGRDANGVPTICHSHLADGITVRWSRLEENVGQASPKTAVNAITSGFEHSPEHAANMLNTQVTYVGAGVAYWGNFVYVTEEFMAP